jgi:hypothetical protein
MLDLFCGRWGWSRAFAARGWECVGIDLTRPAEIPDGCDFIQYDVLEWGDKEISYWDADFICASSPCEEFSKHGLRCFWPDAPYPDLGLRLFNHARGLCWRSKLPWVMENVRAAQDFVGQARHHCGPFYLWGTGVPPLMPQGIQKGLRLGKSGFTGETQKEWRRKLSNPARNAWSGSENRAEATAKLAQIPPELANCVAEYAERICEASVK